MFRHESRHVQSLCSRQSSSFSIIHALSDLGLVDEVACNGLLAGSDGVSVDGVFVFDAVVVVSCTQGGRRVDSVHPSSSLPSLQSGSRWSSQTSLSLIHCDLSWHANIFDPHTRGATDVEFTDTVVLVVVA